MAENKTVAQSIAHLLKVAKGFCTPTEPHQSQDTSKNTEAKQINIRLFSSGDDNNENNKQKKDNPPPKDDNSSSLAGTAIAGLAVAAAGAIVYFNRPSPTEGGGGGDNGDDGDGILHNGEITVAEKKIETETISETEETIEEQGDGKVTKTKRKRRKSTKTTTKCTNARASATPQTAGKKGSAIHVVDSKKGQKRQEEMRLRLLECTKVF